MSALLVFKDIIQTKTLSAQLTLKDRTLNFLTSTVKVEMYNLEKKLDLSAGTVGTSTWDRL